MTEKKFLLIAYQGESTARIIFSFIYSNNQLNKKMLLVTSRLILSTNNMASVLAVHRTDSCYLVS
jgi:hypothetical protein